VGAADEQQPQEDGSDDIPDDVACDDVHVYVCVCVCAVCGVDECVRDVCADAEAAVCGLLYGSAFHRLWIRLCVCVCCVSVGVWTEMRGE